MICSEDGIRPDPQKVEAIQEMKTPENKQELQTFLGLTNYMGQFIKGTSKLTAPLREMLSNKNEFEWLEPHQKAFDEIKNSICKETTLAYFNPTKPITLQVDASMKSLGATIIQDDRPIAFASKALTPEETRYANIERELLAMVYGCERFSIHTFTELPLK